MDGPLANFLLEAVEASQCYFFGNKLHCRKVESTKWSKKTESHDRSPPWLFATSAKNKMWFHAQLTKEI